MNSIRSENQSVTAVNRKKQSMVEMISGPTDAVYM